MLFLSLEGPSPRPVATYPTRPNQPNGPPPNGAMTSPPGTLVLPSLEPFVSFLSPFPLQLLHTHTHTCMHAVYCSLYQKEASCRDKGSPETEQEELTVEFCKEWGAGFAAFHITSCSCCLHATLLAPAAFPPKPMILSCMQLCLLG